MAKKWQTGKGIHFCGITHATELHEIEWKGYIIHAQIHNFNSDKHILSSLLIIVTSSFIGQMVMNDLKWQDLYDPTNCKETNYDDL